MEPIVLVGMSGVGKTTVGRALAGRLSLNFIDMDILISNKESRTIESIFRDSGETYFREVEEEVLFDCLGTNNSIIATGGGVVVSKRNREVLKTKKVFYLEGGIESIYRNVLNDKENIRPILDSDNIYDKINDIYSSRRYFYEEVSSERISIDGKDVDSICKEIICRLKNLSCS